MGSGGWPALHELVASAGVRMRTRHYGNCQVFQRQRVSELPPCHLSVSSLGGPLTKLSVWGGGVNYYWPYRECCGERAWIDAQTTIGKERSSQARRIENAELWIQPP